MISARLFTRAPLAFGFFLYLIPVDFKPKTRDRWCAESPRKEVAFSMMIVRLLLCLALLLAASSVYTQEAALQMGTPFGESMVLQRGEPIVVWGWDVPGRRIRVAFDGEDASAVADDDGRWEARLGPREAGGPHRMTIRGSETVTFDDVLVGEVWLASGQSNMEWPLRWAEQGLDEAAAADWPDIRFLNVHHKGAAEPALRTETTGWRAVTPETADDNSAVAFYFAREVHAQVGVPVGIIAAPWAGSRIEAWISAESLFAGTERYDRQLVRFERWAGKQQNREAQIEEYKEAVEAWRGVTDGRSFHKDPGDDGLERGWHTPRHDDSSWDTIILPSAWEDYDENNEIDGVVWFRRLVEIPESWSGQRLVVSLGRIDDQDRTYWNGERIGATSSERQRSWDERRVYTIDGDRVEPGPSLLAVRVFDQAFGGGLTGPEKDMWIRPLGGGPKEAIALDGAWRHRTATALEQHPKDPRRNEEHVATIAYNGMIHPLMPLRLRGVLWYQGESNCENDEEYLDLSRRWIDCWRRGFDDPGLPFYLVQLAGFDHDWEGWVEVRAAQWETARRMPNVHIATAIDIGDPSDIHPANKRDVGLRLALLALATEYGRDVVYTGPRARWAVAEEGEVRVAFSHVGSRLVSWSGTVEVRDVEVADTRGEFHPAEAVVSENMLVARNAEVPWPTRIRYAWDDYPHADLYNAEGLPAFPFDLPVVRSDQPR